MSSRYDRAYFDKWYRQPQHRVKTAAELRRQVEFVVRLSEWVLGRPLRTVLDVGCGEGQWYPQLRKLRSAVHYDGVDPSAYAVTRFGARRRLQLGGIATLSQLTLRREYDLVVCCGMLNYLSRGELLHGLSQVARVTGGVAYLELFTNTDSLEGDTDWPPPQSTAWYRRAIARAGLHSIGMHGYVPSARRGCVASLERV